MINSYLLKRNYEKHITKVNSIFSNNSFPDVLKTKEMITLIELLKTEFSSTLLQSLIEHNSYYSIEQTESLLVKKDILIAYLSILLCDNIQSAPISIDEDTGEICVWYNANKDNPNSTKITIQICSSNKFVFAILSRSGSLAKMSGELNLTPQSYYKIDSFMNTQL